MYPCKDRRFSAMIALLMMTTALPALAASARTPVKLQIGDHADFSRLALVNAREEPDVEIGPCGGRISLVKPAAWPTDEIAAAYSKRMTGFQVTEDGKGFSLEWSCGARVRTVREGNITMIDIAEPPVPGYKPVPPPSLFDEAQPVAEAPAAEPPAEPVAQNPALPSPGPSLGEEIAAAFAPIGSAQAQPISLRPPAPQSQMQQPQMQPPPAQQPAAQPAPVAQPAPPPAPPPAAAIPVKATTPAPDTLEQSVRQSVDQTIRKLQQTDKAAAPPKAAAPAQPESPPLPPFDLAGWAGTDYVARKQALEQAITTSNGRARVDALIAMARFTLARAMSEEGRAALDAADSHDPAPDQRHELRILADAFRALDGTADPQDSIFVRTPPGAAPDHHVWRSATLAPTRWTAAKEGLPIALKRLLDYPPDLRARLLTLLAEAASVFDAASLNMIVLEMITLDGPNSADGRIDYFRGRLGELQNEPAAALDRYQKAALAPGLYGHRAKIRSIELRRVSGALDDAGTIAELEALRFAWRGDDVETDALAALGEAYTRVGQTEQALELFGLLGRRFGATARGRTALAAGRSLLMVVMDRLEQTRPGALDSLSLQIRHGRAIAQMDDEEATQQRRLARILARDGYVLEAARLLHALAEEARGTRRTEIGLELARVLLDSGRAGEALEVLGSTAGSALEPALAERRALLRAEAFAADGDAMRAIDSLRGIAGPEAGRIRAQSLFRAGEWTAARAAFAELVEHGNGAPDDIAYQALAAFRAGDQEAVNATAERHRARLAGTRWQGLLEALAIPPASNKPLAAAEVTRQLAAADALAGVLQRWQAGPEASRKANP